MSGDGSQDGVESKHSSLSLTESDYLSCRNTRGRRRDWTGVCHRLVQNMLELEESKPCRNPVDALDFPDYYSAISKPLDVSQILLHLHRGGYENMRSFVTDVRLMISNYLSYFGSDKDKSHSEVLDQVLHLSRWFESELTRVSPHCTQPYKEQATFIPLPKPSASSNNNNRIKSKIWKKTDTLEARINSLQEENARTLADTSRYKQHRQTSDRLTANTTSYTAQTGESDSQNTPKTRHKELRLPTDSDSTDKKPYKEHRELSDSHSTDKKRYKEHKESSRQPQQPYKELGELSDTHRTDKISYIEHRTDKTPHKEHREPLDSHSTDKTQYKEHRELSDTHRNDETLYREHRTDKTSHKDYRELSDSHNPDKTPYKEHREPSGSHITNSTKFTQSREPSDSRSTDKSHFTRLTDVRKTHAPENLISQPHQSPSTNIILSLGSGSCTIVQGSDGSKMVEHPTAPPEPLSLGTTTQHRPQLTQPDTTPAENRASEGSSEHSLEVRLPVVNIWFGSVHTKAVGPVEVTDRRIKARIRVQHNVERDIVIQAEDLVRIAAYFGKKQKHTLFLFVLPKFLHHLASITTEEHARCSIIVLFVSSLSGPMVSRLVHVLWSMGHHGLFRHCLGSSSLFSELDQSHALTLLTHVNPDLLTRFSSKRKSQVDKSHHSSSQDPNGSLLNVILGQERARKSQRLPAHQSAEGTAQGPLASRTGGPPPDSYHGEPDDEDEETASSDDEDDCVPIDLTQEHAENMSEEGAELEIMQGSDESEPVMKRMRSSPTLEDGSEDIVMTETCVSHKCPITQSTMRRPLRNKLCGHCYDEAGVEEVIRQRRDKARCPVLGCSNDKPLQLTDLEFDSSRMKEITKKYKKKNKSKHN